MGTFVGIADGRLVGTRVGLLDDGRLLGALVSPGLVGRELTGDPVGNDVGRLLVGIDVGADTSTDCPTTTEALRTVEIEERAAGVNKAGTPISMDARIKLLENFPVDTEVAIVEEIEEVNESGEFKPCV